MTAIKTTAVTQAITTARLVEQSEGTVELEHEAREHMDQFVRLSIAFTARLMVASSPDPSSTIATTAARELETWLTICLDRDSGGSAPAQQASLRKAVQKLATAGSTFGLIMTAVANKCATTGEDPFKVGTPAREQTYALARAAVVFTTQLLAIYSHLDQDAARDQAAVMEDELVEFLDDLPWYEENL